MDTFSAEDLWTIGGIATVSLLHSFIPTHWLPFSIVGRAQKWTLSRTLFVTAFGAVLHVISTALLGITAITMANTIAGEETVHKLASLLLVFLGGSYILLFLAGKGGHTHSHNQPMEKMAVAGLVLVPALSPCATTLPVFLAVGNSKPMMILAIIVLLIRGKNICLKLFDILFGQHHFGDDIAGSSIVLWCKPAEVSLGGAIRQTTGWFGPVSGGYLNPSLP
ncbi:PREDICTED: uncharacterized protein LOC106315921 isoform X2 [Brassica oleracea var. oleracea]|uniref:uncharacterized protein LOC106315921 isoform X2 n=1 Tax=Brassica oleracea var. oleracea TaxID=109376 RepID=UPI0006A73DDE|nr:PREDICTED: uncharacterized protein LOC106315921 isoform X2 [Brassica oleracea var. oleracea]